MNERLIPNLSAYASQRQLQIVEPLGSGKDGIVLVGKGEKYPARVALKAHRYADLYLREKAVYERLQRADVSTVLGFNVPGFLGSDDTLRVLEMTIVKRPFVLDFAGAHLDKRPDFSPEIWTDWETEKREQFEDRWPEVQRLLDAFQGMGIYLLDVSPGNIGFVL